MCCVPVGDKRRAGRLSRVAGLASGEVSTGRERSQGLSAARRRWRLIRRSIEGISTSSIVAEGSGLLQERIYGEGLQVAALLVRPATTPTEPSVLVTEYYVPH